MKLLIIGVDCFDFEIIKKTKNKFFSRLTKESKYGISKSELTNEEVPFTGPNWACLYTGVKPEVHGITDEGWMLKNQKYNDIKVNTIFDLIDKHYSQSLMTLPLTFPAFEVNGWMISGFPTPNSLDNCYFPKDIINYLEDDFEISYDQCTKSMKWGFYNQNEKDKLYTTFVNLGQKHVKQFKKIYSEKPTDVAFIGLTFIDRLSHLFPWKGQGFTYLFSRGSPELKRGYLEVYNMIEELIKFCQPENLVICSDHGIQKKMNSHYPNHDRDGFYLIKSNKYKKMREDISIVDVAKHILYILNIKNTLGETIKRGKNKEDKNADCEIKKRLKSLGYI